MKRSNDILYRQIMSGISKNLKSIIESSMNEDDAVQTEVQKAAEAIWNSCNKNKDQLKGAIAMMKAASGDGKGNGNFKYKGVPYKDLIPALQKYLNDENKGSVNERTRRIRRY